MTYSHVFGSSTPLMVVVPSVEHFNSTWIWKCKQAAGLIFSWQVHGCLVQARTGSKTDAEGAERGVGRAGTTGANNPMPSHRCTKACSSLPPPYLNPTLDSTGARGPIGVHHGGHATLHSWLPVAPQPKQAVEPMPVRPTLGFLLGHVLKGAQLVLVALHLSSSSVKGA